MQSESPSPSQWNDVDDLLATYTPISISASDSFSTLSPPQAHLSTAAAKLSLSRESSAQSPCFSCSSSSSSTDSTKTKRFRPKQREYDRERRRTIRAHFEELRSIIQCAESLTNTGRTIEALPGCELEHRSKFGKTSKTALANCSTIDLLRAAHRTITKLQHMAEDLKKLLSACDDVDSDSKDTNEEVHNELDALEETSYSQSARKRKRVVDDGEEWFDDFHTLLHAISTVHQHYEQELCALKSLESRLPRSMLPDSEQFLKNIGAIGFDGRLLPFTHSSYANLDENSAKAFQMNINKFRSPQVLILHAFCYLLAHGFHYYENGEEQAAPCLNSISQQCLYQFLCDAHSSTQCSYSSSSVDSSHPLSRYGLPAPSFQILLDILCCFVGLGKRQYDVSMQQLTPVAVKAFPKALLDSMCLAACPPYASKEFVFAETMKLEYEDVCAFYDLCSKKKEMVSFQKRRLILPTSGPVYYSDVDLCLVRDPQSGVPLAFMTFHRRDYIGDTLA